jgi:hypothetical protein
VAVNSVAKARGYALFLALDADRIVKIQNSSRGGDGGEFAL